MTWFEALAGFPETSYAQTQRRLRVIMGRLVSEASTRSFEVGALETPSLGDLLCAHGTPAADRSFAPRHCPRRRSQAACRSGQCRCVVPGCISVQPAADGGTGRLARRRSSPATNSIKRRGLPARWRPAQRPSFATTSSRFRTGRSARRVSARSTAWPTSAMPRLRSGRRCHRGPPPPGQWITACGAGKRCALHRSARASMCVRTRTLRLCNAKAELGLQQLQPLAIREP
jgi:hypothetical protein